MGRTYVRLDPLARLFAKVRWDGTDCWIFTGTTKNGYAVIGEGHDDWHYGHRLVYERLVGDIPPRHHVHHECHRTCCINPDHLKAVTSREHANEHGRGVGLCPGCGSSDWYTRPDNGNRMCRVCRRRRRAAIVKMCPWCGTEFAGDSRTCSPRCGTLLYNASLPPRPEPDHGTTARYKRGCKCDRCRAANTEYENARRRRALAKDRATTGR